MASVKWLKNIVVTDKPFEGYWQTFQNSTCAATAGRP